MENIENLQESRQATVIGVTCFVLTVATLAVAARLYTRAFIIRTVGIDDYMAVVSLVSPLTFVSSSTAPSKRKTWRLLTYFSFCR